MAWLEARRPSLAAAPPAPRSCPARSPGPPARRHAPPRQGHGVHSAVITGEWVAVRLALDRAGGPEDVKAAANELDAVRPRI